MKNLKQKEGITLIALVITIIVLLILAGVTINMLTGDSGILKNAQSAGRRTELAQIKEQVELLKVEQQMGGTTIASGTLEKALGTDVYNKYAEKIYVFGGALVYDPEKCSENEIEDAQAVGLKSMEEYTIIRTADDLKAFRDDVDNGNTYEGKEVYLMNDITLDITEEWNPIGFYSNEVSRPTEGYYIPFKGIFNGCGYEIDGIYINTTEKAQGLFGFIEKATIKNLGIGKNCNITGGACTAGLVGYTYNKSTIENCYNKADIQATVTSAGITGVVYANSSIKNSYNEGEITVLGDNAGGIVGVSNNNDIENGKNTIENCYNTAKITGINMVGGIGGNNGSTTITESYNTGNITGEGYNIGGIVGRNYTNSTINKSYNTGSITGEGYNIGGIVGHNLDNSTITESHNTGNITGEGYTVGGITGINNDNCTITKSYNIGTITGTGIAVDGASSVGGVAGFNGGKILQSYNNGDINGAGGTNVAGIAGQCFSKTITPIIENCYNTGNVTSSGVQVGGITGKIQPGIIKNCYNIGTIITNSMNNVSSTVGIIRIINENTNAIFEISKTFSLENIVNNANGVILEGASVKTSDELKELAPILGDAFTEDSTNINNGYPILKWQLENK